MSNVSSAQSKAAGLLRVLRAGQVTLPAELRRQARIREGDYLEAEVVEGRVILKPVAVMSREEAWRQIRQAQASVRYVGPEPRPSPEEEEALIYQAVEDYRREHGESGAR